MSDARPDHDRVRLRLLRGKSIQYWRAGRHLQGDQGSLPTRWIVTSRAPAVFRLPSTQASRRPGPAVQGTSGNVHPVAPGSSLMERSTPPSDEMGHRGEASGSQPQRDRESSRRARPAPPSDPGRWGPIRPGARASPAGSARSGPRGDRRSRSGRDRTRASRRRPGTRPGTGGASAGPSGDAPRRCCAPRTGRSRGRRAPAWGRCDSPEAPRAGPACIAASGRRRPGPPGEHRRDATGRTGSDRATRRRYPRGAASRRLRPSSLSPCGTGTPHASSSVGKRSMWAAIRSTTSPAGKCPGHRI